MRLSFNNSNNIYIRNLAPDITEDVVRDTFKHCDDILSIQFKSYHGSTRKYCIVEFKTYAGITNGSLLNGTPMLGLPLEITVTDPVTHNYDSSSVALGSRNTIQWQYGNVSNGSGDDPGSRQRLDKTIYIENIPKDYDKTDIHTLFSNVGDIVGCCIEPSSINPTVSAIVEFNTNSEAEEALKLDGITVNNHTLKYVASSTDQSVMKLSIFHALADEAGSLRERIERSKLLVFENAPLPGVLDLPLNLVAEELPVRSTTINAKMAKVLEMREKLSRKLSYQQTDASNRTERDDDNAQWWLDISKRRRYYGRRRSRSNSIHHRSKDKYSSRRHRYRSRSPSSSSSGNSRSHSRRRRRRSRSRSRRHKRS